MSRLTVKQLFNFLCEDLEHLINFNVVIVDKGNTYPEFSANKMKDENEYLIKYMTDAGNQEIENIEDLMKYVVLFCHELGHCLNAHSTYRAEENVENQALEAHADFLGGRLSTAFYTYGPNLKKIVVKDYQYPEDEQRNKQAYCKLMGNVFSKLYFEYYKDNSHPRYPHPTQRVSLNIAGVCSFFYRSPQFQAIPGEYITMNMVMTLALDSEIHQELHRAHQTGQANSNFIKHVYSVHRKIQGEKSEINDIEAPHLEHLFGSRFYKSEVEQQLHKEFMKKEILTYAKQKNIADLVNEEIFEDFDK